MRVNAAPIVRDKPVGLRRNSHGWVKTVVESTTAGEPVLEVQSDKPSTEEEATVSGTLAGVMAEERQILKPDDPLAVIAEPRHRTR